MKKKSSLLICIATALVISIGGCSQKEIDDIEDIELISEDPYEVISYLTSEDSGLDYDISSWGGIDFLFELTLEDTFYDSFSSTLNQAKLIKGQDSYSSGLIFRSDFVYYESEILSSSNEQSYLEDGLLYKYEENENEYTLNDLSLLDIDTQYVYSIDFFLDYLMMWIEDSVLDEYIFHLIDEDYDITSELIKVDESLVATLTYSKEEESDLESFSQYGYFELVFNNEGKLISYIDDIIYYSTYYEQDDDGAYNAYTDNGAIIREGSLYEGESIEAPSWVEDNFDL